MSQPLNPPPNPDELSVVRLLWTALRLARSPQSKAKAAFLDQVAARDPDIKRSALSPWSVGTAVVLCAISTLVGSLIFGAAAWGGLHVTPWMGAAIDNYRCSRSPPCEPIAIRVVSTTALSAAQWTQAFAFEGGRAAPRALGLAARRFQDAERRDDPYFLLDESDLAEVASILAQGDQGAQAAAREKSEAGVASEFIRQLTKGLAPAQAAALALAPPEAPREPTASARARLAILASPAISISPTESRQLVTPAALWLAPAHPSAKAWAARTKINELSSGNESWLLLALFVFLLLLCIIFFVCDTILGRLNFHRPELEKAAEVFGLEAAANLSAARREQRQSGRL